MFGSVSMADRDDRDSRYQGASRATVSGILDLFRRPERIGCLEPEERIDGKTCLVTGANRGLGRAAAVELARRGGRVVMACRSGHPHAAEEVRSISGSEAVEMARVDLADLESIEGFAAAMKHAGRSFDIVVLNAGVVPNRARRTVQGFEEMFAVNYLANFILVTRLLEHGTIPLVPLRNAGGSPHGEPVRTLPRLVFVTSEVHRSAPPIDFAGLGEFRDYGMRGAMTEYAVNKLLVSTFAVELSRHLLDGDEPRASVHQLCPGPINSGIAREAPVWIKPLLKVLFALFFRTPRRAAEPVVFLCCSQAIEGRTGIYLHLMTEKSPSAAALDPEAGRRLWQASQRLIRTVSRKP
jgi:NAD(P)-dependent dehydrogenase (short-subunit alcohol dehydrogenase family)